MAVFVRVESDQDLFLDALEIAEHTLAEYIRQAEASGVRRDKMIGRNGDDRERADPLPARRVSHQFSQMPTTPKGSPSRREIA